MTPSRNMTPRSVAKSDSEEKIIRSLKRNTGTVNVCEAPYYSYRDANCQTLSLSHKSCRPGSGHDLQRLLKNSISARFVSGRDFSRAEQSAGTTGALAPGSGAPPYRRDSILFPTFPSAETLALCPCGAGFRVIVLVCQLSISSHTRYAF